MKSEIRNPCLAGRQAKSETNSKPKFSNFKTCFDHLNFGNSRLFRISIFDIRIFMLICALSLVILVTGCDAFVRKFTRKPKKENLPKEEMVLAPQEYKGPQMSKEDLYRQYFLFWKSWQDELTNALMQKASQKKQIDCAQEAIKNLINLKSLLNEEKQKKLDVYIGQLNELKELITKDIYSSNAASLGQSVERIKRSILRDFSYKNSPPPL